MDMGDDKPDDSAFVRSARVAIAAKLAEWLSLPGAGSVGAHDEGVAVVARR
jgi:hypothetical protein